VVRPLPGILSGVLAAAAVIAAFASVVWVVAPRSGEPARWPGHATVDRESLRLLAPAPAALPVFRAAAAVRARVAPTPRSPRVAPTPRSPRTPRRAATVRPGSAQPAPAAPVRAPGAAAPTATPRVAAAPAAERRADSQAAPQSPAAPAGPLNPAATTVESASSSAGQAITPVSPQAGAAVVQAGATVADVIRGL